MMFFPDSSHWGFGSLRSSTSDSAMAQAPVRKPSRKKPAIGTVNNKKTLRSKPFQMRMLPNHLSFRSSSLIIFKVPAPPAPRHPTPKLGPQSLAKGRL